MLTKKAQTLRQMPIKKMFNCEELANAEVKKFKEWFKVKYKHDYFNYNDVNLANAIYEYVSPEIGEKIQLGKESVWLSPKKNVFTTSGPKTLKELLEEKTGNCVSFTSLFCMLAEELVDENGKKIVNAHPFFSRIKLNDMPPLDTGHLSVAVKTADKIIHYDPSQKVSHIDYQGEIVPKEELMVMTLNQLGVMAGNNGNITDAIKYFNKALKITPNSARVLYNKALTFDDFERFGDAIDIFDQMLKANKSDIHAWHGKGVVLAKMGNWKDAITHFHTAININESHPLTYYIKNDLKDVNEWKEKYYEFLSRKKMIEEAKDERHHY